MSFTEEAPCENGMWVDANKANGEIKLVSDVPRCFWYRLHCREGFTPAGVLL